MCPLESLMATNALNLVRWPTQLCFLHRHGLPNLVLEGCPQEDVSDLRFLDGQGEEVDFLQRLDLQALDQLAWLGDGDPLLVLSLASVSSVTVVVASDATVKTSTEAPGSSGPSRGTHILGRLVLSRRRSLRHDWLNHGPW